jgi:hypothetical protein
MTRLVLRPRLWRRKRLYEKRRPLHPHSGHRYRRRKARRSIHRMVAMRSSNSKCERQRGQRWCRLWKGALGTRKDAITDSVARKGRPMIAIATVSG